MPCKYVHQFLTSNGEWDTVVNDDGTPATFDTQAEADADMEAFHRSDWRVVKLEK